MKLEDIIDFIDERIPPSLALDFDEVGFKRDYDLNEEISEIKIYMDLLVEDDSNLKNTLIITHHPPEFTPETPTYTIHSNWDIIDGGANDALADTLNLKVIDYLDDETHIGRVCGANRKFHELKKDILDNFGSARIVNDVDDGKAIGDVAIISGFGLKNPKYAKLAKDKGADILISGDLTHETAILAKNLQMTVIDLNHHESEVPGLYGLGKLLEELDVDVEIIDKKPIEKLKIQ